jgi:hypothetical protein
MYAELYVATNLDTWEAKPPVRLDQDEICEPCGYRRLEPEYYAWLRSRMTLAQKLHRAGRLSTARYEALRERFNAVHHWAVERYGEAPLLEAVHTLDASEYDPPKVHEPEATPAAASVPETPLHLYPTDGNWRCIHRVELEAVAKVDAIRDRAFALGWSEALLYQNRGRYAFPCDEDWGLVCFIGPKDEIGEVTRESIEIVTGWGSRLRFRRPLRANNSKTEGHDSDTLATLPVSIH